MRTKFDSFFPLNPNGHAISKIQKKLEPIWRLRSNFQKNRKIALIGFGGISSPHIEGS